jgi:methionine-rich copper-binding protein CopC
MSGKASRLILIFAFLSFSFAPAAAHTSVVKTVPEYKSTLSEMPPSISIEFTDVLMTLGEKKVNSIELTSPDGSPVAIESTSIDQRTLTVQLPEQSFQDGTYLVSYRVVSADGHSISGSYELYLNTPSKGVAPIEEHQSFFHIHQGHIIQAGVALILILLWWGYRRFTREQEL